MKTHFHSPKTHFGVYFMDKLAPVAATTTTVANSAYVLTITTKFVFMCMLTKAVQSIHNKPHTHLYTRKWSNDFYRPTLSQCQRHSKESKTSFGVTGAGLGAFVGCSLEAQLMFNL